MGLLSRHQQPNGDYMKKFLRMIVTATLLTANLAQADCLPHYNEKIKGIQGKMQNFKTTLVTTAISETALVGGIALIAGTVSPLGVLVMPASMVGAGTYLGALAIQKNKLTKAAKLIKEARAGKGKALNKLGRSINKKLGMDLRQKDLAVVILEANDNDVFCELNERTEKVKLMGYSKMVKYLKEKVRAGI